MYGLNREETASYGKRCLMARRLVERGVRFVQLYIESQIWDAHSNLDKMLRYSCAKTDQPVAALLTDLKQRGLLDSTLVVWGGEFGRLPLSQTQASGVAGRDHGPSGFTVWMAGAASRAAPPTEPPTSSDTRPWRIGSASTISTPPSCTSWA